MQKRNFNSPVLTKLFVITSVVSILLLPLQASASGSYSPKASGYNNGAKNQNYNYGKNAIQQKLFCSACPMANSDLNSTQARQILRSLNVGNNDISNSLTRREQQSISVYLKRRFGL